MCHLAITQAPNSIHGGYVVLNAVNDTITNFEKASEFLQRVQPGVEQQGSRLGDQEAPVRNWKARRVLEWREQWNWRKIWEEQGLKQEAR